MISDVDKSQFVTVEVEGVTYTDIVTETRRMDPETEIAIYGDDLDENMVVLLGVQQRRDERRPQHYGDLPVRNRWCTVKRVRAEESGIYFIGVYEDGDMCVRQTAHTAGWIVKKISIPVRTDDEDEPEDDGYGLRVETAEGIVKL